MAGSRKVTGSVNSTPDNIGKKYGKMTVIGIEHQISSNGKYKYVWRCRCDCGNERIVAPAKLKSGHTKSCGCGKIERIKVDPSMNRTTHGGRHDRLYHIWRGIKQRCHWEASKDYPRYGGRGIIVCDEWRNDYAAFREWAFSHGYDNTLTIERKDVNGNYCPENCCWIPLVDQSKNKTTSHWVEYNGERHIVSDWARIYGLKDATLHNRLRLGWSMERTINTPEVGKAAIVSAESRPF